MNNSANAHSGSYYADLTAPAGSVSTTLTTTQPISAQIGETITSTGWVYRESGNNPVYSRWWLSVVGTNGSVASHAADSSTMNAWVYQTNSVVVPSWLQGPYTVTVAAQVISNAGVVAARFDDATLNGSNLLFAEDSLGTTRVTTDPSGVVCYDADFYPFGGERTPYTNSCSPTYKFEGKERDAETGNDEFGARYYSNRFGRWLSADWSNVPVPIPYAKLTNPQTLNLYAMVSDDPESFGDLDGHYDFNASGCGTDIKCQRKWEKAEKKFEARRQKNLKSKKEAVRAAAAAYGALGEANGVHVGFANLRFYGSVDPGGSIGGQKLIQVTLDFGRAGNSETITHEGTHVADDTKFLNSYNPLTRGYDESLNITHGQSEFNSFKAGAFVTHEHGFGPNDSNKIWDFLHSSPTYRDILNVPLFETARFPASAPVPTAPSPTITVPENEQ